MRSLLKIILSCLLALLPTKLTHADKQTYKKIFYRLDYNLIHSTCLMQPASLGNAPEEPVFSTYVYLVSEGQNIIKLQNLSTLDVPIVIEPGNNHNVLNTLSEYKTFSLMYQRHNSLNINLLNISQSGILQPKGISTQYLYERKHRCRIVYTIKVNII